MNRQPYAGPARRRRSLMSPRRDGQIIIIIIIAMILMVALVMFVYNVGDHTNNRLEVQNSADSAAIGGGTWMARSMNVIAMNNVGMSKCLSLVPVLDAFPLASEMAYEETYAWEQALRGQLSRHYDERASTRSHINGGLEALRERMDRQSDILRPMDELLNESGFHMEETTHWNVRGAGGPPPHGQLWQAAVTMDEISQATAESAGILAQANAYRFGRRNYSDASFLVPIQPRLPAVRTSIRDFGPTLEGRVHVTSDQASYRDTGGRGGAIPDTMYPHRLGPWARLHRWRDYTRRSTGRQWVPGTPGYGKTRGGGGVDVGGRRVGSSARTRTKGRRGHWRSTGSEVTGYTAYGPYSWAMRRIHNWTDDDYYWDAGNIRRLNPGHLPDTYFYSYLNKLARTKLNYMFHDRSPRTIHYPLWEIDYDKARTIASDPFHRVNKTMYYLVEIASSVPDDSPQWLSPGTYRTNGEHPLAIWLGGWQDAGEWNIPKLGNHVWKDQYTYETTGDPEIGIQPIDHDNDGQPDEWQTVYFYAWYIFGGIDIGGDREIINPCNWDEYDVLPAPIMLDTEQGDYDPLFPDPDRGFRRDYFTYLSVVARNNRPEVWPSNFKSGSPTESMYAFAQVKVFNNSSFDLWTQDWQAQLMPVTQYQNWNDTLQAGLPESANNPLINANRIEDIAEYMDTLYPGMVDTYTNH
ncbi:MAG: pilus assembly protein TadG-related protein [Phycisphaerae bacterium]